MSEQSREEKVMAYSDDVLHNLQQNEINQDEFVVEYEKLLNNYMKLLKRYKKIVKLGDAFNASLVNDNIEISKKARSKIMANATEQRKLKEGMALENLDDKNKVKQLAKLLKTAMLKIELLEEREQHKRTYIEKHKITYRKKYQN